jgi:hypothetical protein
MRVGLLKAAGLWLLFGMAAIGLAACGSGAETTTTTARPAVSRTTADHLAKLSNQIASDLDAGDLCHAAHAADDLSDAVENSDLPANLRPGVEAVASDLVNQVNCPPPPLPPPEPERKPQKPEKKKPDEHGNGNGDEHGNGNGDGHGKGTPAHGGFVPPGQAKLKGEEG